MLASALDTSTLAANASRSGASSCGQAGLDDREPFDLAAVTSHVLAARQPEAAYQKLTLQAALGAVPAAGSPRLAERLAANLVDNAPGGWAPSSYSA